MTMHVHTLTGCSPTPLAHYLKALGILRLVAEQADRQARGWWQDEHFRLLTSLSREELEKFFLERYEPTPLLSPWNKGCGFFKTNDPGLVPIETSRSGRFACFRRGIGEARQLLDAVTHADAVIRAIKARTKTNKTFQTEKQRQLLESSETYREFIDHLHAQSAPSDSPVDQRNLAEQDLQTVESLVRPASKPSTRAEADALKASSGYKRLLAVADRRFKALKATLIPDCRRLWRGRHAEWLAAAVVVDESGNPEWPSLLGTGGNDGNLDFTNNFMQQLGGLFDLTSESGGSTGTARAWLENCLWTEPANMLTGTAVGQYQPGAAGGANSSTGFASGNLVNPWDYVLMMEGSLVFSSRATRRFDPNASSRASAPFAVRPHAAGFATSGTEKAQRGEQWMPLWTQPATLSDLNAMVGEARIQLQRETANRPIDMARAISRLGVARGIDAFTRYGYLERNGQSTLAVPLGRVWVRQQPQSYLIDDLAGWLNKLQLRSRDKHAPTRLIHAERRLADAVFAALTHDHTAERWQEILHAAVAVEAIQATGTAIEAGPIPRLRPEWVAAVDDNTPELRLALALGSAAAGYRYKPGFRVSDPVRHHWLPLELGARRFKTSDKRLALDPRVVMSGRDALADLAAVVERRLVEASMKGQRRLRLVAAQGCGARPGDLAEFLRGGLDVDRLLSLARAFMTIQWTEWTREHAPAWAPSDETPDEAWLALRLACLPWPLSSEKDIPADPRIVRLLTSGNSARAIEVALGRLRSSGIRPPLQTGVIDHDTSRLWAAAFAFPITQRTALRAAAILDPSQKGTIRA